MMGRKQKLSGLEEDYVYARNVYRYLVNTQHLRKFIRRLLNKRYRQQLHAELVEEYEEYLDE